MIMSDPVLASQLANGTGEMDGLCSELLLIPPPLSNHGILGPVQNTCTSGEPASLPADPGCLLVEATATEESPGNMEIIVEAVAGTLTPEASGETSGVLVKVVEVYFCERCEQSFAEPTLLSLHQCTETHIQTMQDLSSPPCSVELPPSNLTLHGPLQDPSLPDSPLPCPICRQEFVQPQALKSHFKIHRVIPNTFSCPESDCVFSAEDRKGLHLHLRQTHKAVPVPCSFRGCSLLFGSQQGMELHRQAHYPFHCSQCSFMGSNVKLFRQHQRSHGASTRGELSAVQGLPSQDLLPASKLSPGEGEPSEEAGTPFPGQESAEDIEEEESGTQKDSQKVLDKSQGTQQSEAHVASSTESLFKTHMCPECKRCFKKRTHLVEHLHLHFPDPSLQCPNCQKFFTSKSKLKTHLLRELGEKAHQCPLCHYSAVERNALNRHMASMHENISNFYSDTYACPVCREEFRLSQALKEHLKSHTAAAAAEPLPLHCFQEGCTYVAPDRKAFIKHLKETHGVRAVECRHHSCPMLFATAEAMEAHHKSHYAFHCPHCDFACSNKHLFRKHKKQGHPGSEELRCTFCPFATFNPVAYQDHVGKMHAHEKIHQCPECNFATAHKRVLIRHMLLHTGEKPHKCELCDFTCRDVSYLSKHMLTHSNTKDYMCTECGYVTKWKHYLSVHMRKHAGDLRYQCNQCSYRCHRADQLSSHKLRHQGKSLMCEVCAFACKRKYELQKHMASQHHPGTPAPLYPCRYCSYQSRHKQALLSHENCKHTHLREFHCALCDYRTFSNTTLFFHKRKVHGYMPGDQVWQFCNASQELEGSRQCLAPPSDSGPSNQLSAQPERQDHEHGIVADSSVDQALPKTSDEISTKRQDGIEAPQGDDLVGSPSPGEVEEGGCTLHLEALRVELEPVAEPPPIEELTETAPVEFRPLDPSGPLGMERPDGLEEPELSSFESVGTPGLIVEEPILEKLVSEPPRNPLISEETPDTFKATLSAETAPLPQFPESESLLKALRRQDKEQAEALVLEGRVQMVVIQGEGRVFRCPHCPFITRREKALTLHSKSGCQSRREPLLCPECGASFKQQRGLSTHMMKKCPVLLRKNKALPRPVSPTRHPQLPGSQASQDAESGKPPPLPAKVALLLPKDAPSELPGEPRVEEPLPTPSDLPSSLAGKPLPTGTSEKFHFKQGKFHCSSCTFLCSRLSSITSHVTEGCRGERSQRRKRGRPQTHPAVLPLNNGDSTLLNSGSTESSPGDRGTAVVQKQKGALFSCPTCPFSCQQERTLRTHQTQGCPLDSGDLHCGLCPFIASAAAALRLHQRRRHPTTAPTSGSRPLLQCGDCGFTCKQSRCLQQHRRLKHEGVKPHQCPFCDFSTTRRYRLEAHQSRHTGVGRIPCSSCPQTFGTNSKLRLHRLRVHDKTPTHFCPLCDYSGYLRHDITRHVNSCHQGTPSFSCSQCEAQFSSETALKQHALRRHPEPTHPSPGCPVEATEGPLHCSQCGLLCPSPASLRGHIRKQHPRLECGACQETFPSRPALDEHRRQHHFSHRCQLCNFAARERVGLVKHYLEQHEETSAAPSGGDGDSGQPSLCCPFCDFACRYQLVLDHHVKGHGGTRLYKCTDCAYSTKNRQKITWHSRIHTGEKPYRCHLCSYACADPSRLKYHMRIHKEERKYLCPECGYKCKWVNQLKYHMTKHTGLKPYQCPECEYCTNRADALRVHRETRHREARAFMCEQCGKAFKTRFLLRTHLRKHSEAKPYVCNVCHRAFRWAAGLRHHALTHTDRHPFFCRLCSYKAKQKFQVVKHVRRHHPDQADPNQGVGKDPTTPTVHLHDVKLEDPSPSAPPAPPTGPEG
ncbi:zinc finger protein 142 isoform X1 [Cricetulus griseus]|uniref:Zinc finger protein 142 n=1 Tax=Cricetulus griseus TaxID=10029 RepID=A0A9J7FBH4_CRIGR|nr:zinc finger protein 142 isoform X1 [Cricetulus griseus]XP_027253023.1 zinc finger protein 142 isoform X1 [Cricetulus griseus]XP_027253024.1 zinc finger protein 142 isoform X1 [Cricetulus griseus]XP_027253025.1 zinc finger protein 142 isoform X1 [Cricetulus griseus]XP_027253026.1 zinc finger protein 142 isoform X1 [Cricetulus griseus]XP_027253027.1 zinc finger protein 142 isoform X1 [Cricetulus griseus]XP_027253028.1 zinc finger protein 142 isoform X1 [Cricetulus griseus]XP_027253029.1 zin